VLSRVAEAIYWCSRYVERAENVARFVDVTFNMQLDTRSNQRSGWEALVMTTGDQDWFREHYGEPSPENVMRFLTFDTRYPNSIVSAVKSARDNARTVREVISREMWEELNALYLMVTQAAKKNEPLEELAAFFSRVKLAGVHYQGITNATMSHGEPWHFATLGQAIERADKTSRILDVKYFILLPQHARVGTTVDQVGWAALLNSASALQMYRQRHQVLEPAHVAQFLILDRDFPRSIHHCVMQAQNSLHSITKSPLNSYGNDAERRLGQLRARLDYADIQTIMSSGLHEYLDHVQLSLNEVGTAVHKRFFEIAN
jgi:uncharacterized alpha-E superfamily protein